MEPTETAESSAAILNRLRQYHQAQNESTEKAAKELQTLRLRIQAGKSTGNPLHDYLILLFGDFTTEQERAYLDLEADLAAHVGEFVLLFTPEVKARYAASCFGAGEKLSDEEPEILRLGLVAAERPLRIGNPGSREILLPFSGQLLAEQYAYLCTRDFHFRREIVIETGLGMVFDPTQKPFLHRGHERNNHCIVGDEKVAAWFETRMSFPLHVALDQYVRLAALLGRMPVLGPVLARAHAERCERIGEDIAFLEEERAFLVAAKTFAEARKTPFRLNLPGLVMETEPETAKGFGTALDKVEKRLEKARKELEALLKIA